MEEKKKKPRFNEKELEVLVTLVKEKNDILFGKFTDVISNSKKREAWQYVAQGVNAVSFTLRSVDELKKKWDDMKRGTKKRASAVKNDRIKTGGGKPDVCPLIRIEEDVVSILGEERVFGLTSGVDTMDIKTPCKAGDVPQPYPIDVDVHVLPMKAVTTPNVDVMQNSDTKPPQMKRKRLSDLQYEENESIALQRQLVEIEKERLALERERLRIERRRLEIEESRCGETPKLSSTYTPYATGTAVNQNQTDFELFRSAFNLQNL